MLLACDMEIPNPERARCQASQLEPESGVAHVDAVLMGISGITAAARPDRARTREATHTPASQKKELLRLDMHLPLLASSACPSFPHPDCLPARPLPDTTGYFDCPTFHRHV